MEQIFAVNFYLVRNSLEREDILKVQPAEHMQMYAFRSQSKEDAGLQYEKETKKM